MKNNKAATTGEVSFYNEVQGKKITAINGNSGKGLGWRPVCGGKYLGEAVCTTESEAIIEGKKFMAELKRRVEQTERNRQAAVEKVEPDSQQIESDKTPDPTPPADSVNNNNPEAIPPFAPAKTNRRIRKK